MAFLTVFNSEFKNNSDAIALNYTINKQGACFKKNDNW